jgi:hypothetical protein
VGATGNVSKSFRQYIRNITGKYVIKELQKKQPYWALLHTSGSTNVRVKVKVKQSRYRPGVAQRVPGS